MDLSSTLRIHLVCAHHARRCDSRRTTEPLSLCIFTMGKASFLELRIMLADSWHGLPQFGPEHGPSVTLLDYFRSRVHAVTHEFTGLSEARVRSRGSLHLRHFAF